VVSTVMKYLEKLETLDRQELGATDHYQMRVPGRVLYRDQQHEQMLRMAQTPTEKPKPDHEAA
ncbi:MAG: hypothetical protein AAF593_16065, partial [Planctomycetota bacterium]